MTRVKLYACFLLFIAHAFCSCNSRKIVPNHLYYVDKYFFDSSDLSHFYEIQSETKGIDTFLGDVRIGVGNVIQNIFISEYMMRGGGDLNIRTVKLGTFACPLSDFQFDSIIRSECPKRSSLHKFLKIYTDKSKGDSIQFALWNYYDSVYGSNRTLPAPYKMQYDHRTSDNSSSSVDYPSDSFFYVARQHVVLQNNNIVFSLNQTDYDHTIDSMYLSYADLPDSAPRLIPIGSSFKVFDVFSKNNSYFVTLRNRNCDSLFLCKVDLSNARLLQPMAARNIGPDLYMHKLDFFCCEAFSIPRFIYHLTTKDIQYLYMLDNGGEKEVFDRADDIYYFWNGQLHVYKLSDSLLIRKLHFAE